LLDQVSDPVASFTADGAFDRDVYAEVAARHPEADVMPPRSSVVPSDTAEAALARRAHHLQVIAERGRMGWQVQTLTLGVHPPETLG
jgi:hypothetical protein